MTEKTCEHEWDDSQDIDNFTDLVDLNPQFVQIKVRCCKCGKEGDRCGYKLEARILGYNRLKKGNRRIWKISILFTGG